MRWWPTLHRPSWHTTVSAGPDPFQARTPCRNGEGYCCLRWRAYAEEREVQQGARTVKPGVRYQGLPLRELLDQAVLAPDRHAVRRAVVLLTARDGYRVSFSWGELYNSSQGDGVILVRSQDGRDLIEADGLPALRSLHDTRSGPRHVRWLERVEVLVPGG